MTDTSSGTRSPARRPPGWRPSASGSLAQTSAVAPARDQGGGRPPGRPGARTGSAATSARRAGSPAAARTSRAASSLRADGLVVARAEDEPDPGVPQRAQVFEGLLERRSRRRRPRGGRAAVDAGVDQDDGQLAPREPLVVRVVGVGLAVVAAGEDDARRPAAARAACRRTPPRRRRRSSGCRAPGSARSAPGAEPTTSARAGKIGFCSSGSTRPTRRARSPRSLEGRS